MPPTAKPVPTGKADVVLPEEDGVEIDSEEATITRPFDPQRIKVQSTTLLIGQMVTRMVHGEIRAPDFQRKAGIWNQQRRSRLIESLLLRIPIPVFYFAADEEDNWSVVDGLQRTTTIFEYVQGKFPLRGLEYLGQHEGMRYGDLPRAMQRRIQETSLTVNVIQPGTPEEVTFNIFRRINTGGMTLTGQEIRHALHKGPVLAFLGDLAASEAFVEATNGSVNPDRMADRECVLRFMAFRDHKWRAYDSTGDLDRWLSAAMHDINGLTDRDRDRLQVEFERTLKAAVRIFEDRAFRKWYAPEDDRRRPVNKALFEVWSVGLATAAEHQDRLVARRRNLISGFHELMDQDEFEGAVSTATGTPKKVRHRFRAIENLIRECLQC